VGEAAARVLAERFETIDALMTAKAEELEQIEGIGPVLAQSIAEFFANDGNRQMIARLREGGVQFPPYRAARGGGPLDGKTFVITGTLSEPRGHFKKLIEQNGGKVTGSVSSNTDYLLCGEDPGSKRDKAEKLKVPIIGEDELRKLLGGK